MTIGKEDTSEKDLGNYVCHVCFTPNRYFLTTSIPIDDGYKKPIKICASCGEKIGKLAEQLSLLKVK
ncbi:hypothetical protein ABD91_26155 [Lysinibacillus sphaericus]|uniref:hypothetical protein n=1 Tax=Lysinibacillus sphaericus TaxID=1421 RepID=UPI0018CF0433|nr:hypothetical protein [Lysinibacillus sphaericus]MBG9694216.1 hypothetical protein [Lysinibacillus sphaericus]